MTGERQAARDHAAIVLTLLEEAEASALLARFDPDELETLGLTMTGLPDPNEAAIVGAIARFVEQAEASGHAGGGGDRFRAMVTRAFDPLRAQGVLARVAPEAANPTIELARWLAPEALVPLIEDEHPQALAALLLLLEPGHGAAVLAALPREAQSPVVERIARMDGVRPEAVEMLTALLEARIRERFGASALPLGGVAEAAALINRAAGVEAHVLPELMGRDEPLARAIEAQLFTFDLVLALEPLAMGRLLRDVAAPVLVEALAPLSEEAREPVFAAMAGRAADTVRDEIAERGTVKKADSDAAQATVLLEARRLSDLGELTLRPDQAEAGGEYV